MCDVRDRLLVSTSHVRTGAGGPGSNTRSGHEHYDRRGRGESTDTQPYSVRREVEDIEALANAVSGSAYLSGISSGAALALEAALALRGTVTKLAMYEPAYNDDADARRSWRTLRHQLTEALAEGRRRDADGQFMTLLGVPAEQLPEMHQFPTWPTWEAIAPTIAYDAEVLGDDASVPVEHVVGLAVPTPVMAGEASYPFLQVTAAALADAIPDAELRTLAGQTHEVTADALAPALVEFFAADASGT
jgi:alpha-beta hydrolase superfamily lysophospholipase